MGFFFVEVQYWNKKHHCDCDLFCLLNAELILRRRLQALPAQQATPANQTPMLKQTQIKHRQNTVTQQKQTLSIRRDSASFSPSDVHTGAINTILARSCFTANTRPPVDVEPMFTMSTSPFISLATRVCFLSPSLFTPSKRRSRKKFTSSSVKISGSAPLWPSTCPTRRSARHRNGSIFVPAPINPPGTAYYGGWWWGGGRRKDEGGRRMMMMMMKRKGKRKRKKRDLLWDHWPRQTMTKCAKRLACIWFCRSRLSSRYPVGSCHLNENNDEI